MNKELKLSGLTKEDKDNLWHNLLGTQLKLTGGGLGLFLSSNGRYKVLYFCRSLLGLVSWEYSVGFDDLSRGRPIEVINWKEFPRTVTKFPLDEVRRVKSWHECVLDKGYLRKTSEASKLAVSTIKDGQKLSANITIAGASGKELTLIEFAGLSGGGDDDFSGMVIRAATKYSPVEIVRASLVTPQPGIPVRV